MSIVSTIVFATGETPLSHPSISPLMLLSSYQQVLDVRRADVVKVRDNVWNEEMVVDYA